MLLLLLQLLLCQIGRKALCVCAMIGCGGEHRIIHHEHTFQIQAQPSIIPGAVRAGRPRPLSSTYPWLAWTPSLPLARDGPWLVRPLYTPTPDAGPPLRRSIRQAPTQPLLLRLTRPPGSILPLLLLKQPREVGAPSRKRSTPLLLLPGNQSPCEAIATLSDMNDGLMKGCC